MRKPSVLNTIVSHQSRSWSSLVFRFLSIAALIVTLTLPAAAAGTYYPEEVEEWVNIDSYTPYYQASANAGGVLYLMQYGDQVLRNDIHNDDPGTQPAINFGSTFELKKGYTYNLRFVIFGDVDQPYDNNRFKTFSGFSVTEEIPKLLSDIIPSGTNSIQLPYVDLIKTTGVSNGLQTTVSIYFSTADGYIDNTLLGDVFLNFLFVDLDKNDYDLYVTTFSTYVRHDPDGEYFANLWAGKMDEAADQFLDHTNQLAEKEKEISGMANEIRAGVVDRFSGMLSDVSGFVSPVATLDGEGSSNIYAPAMAFANIYSSIMGSLPPIVLVLFTVVPMLAFLAWLFGFGKGL